MATIKGVKRENRITRRLQRKKITQTKKELPQADVQPFPLSSAKADGAK
jgi:hypothetical protein